MSMLTALLSLSLPIPAGCAEQPPPPPIPAPVDYAALKLRIETDRAQLAARSASREEARPRLLAAIADDLIPAWLGTDWDFYGTSPTPRSGSIACGHFLGVVLRDAGFRIDRLAVGRLASERIIGLFAEPAERHRFRDAAPDEVVRALDPLSPGVYGVGLDYHAGLLIRRTEGAPLRFCHASYVDDAVVCEDPVDSPAFVSRYRVFGSLLTDRAIDAWLSGTTIAVPE